MNKIFRISTLLSLCAAALLSSCTTEEPSTAQFVDKGVYLSAIAPNPVARGGALRIIGSNLQDVKEVHLLGIDPITDIEVVSSGKVSEIRVIVPIDGPEVGPVYIKTKDGEIISSYTELTYTEPVILTEMTCASTVLSGDVITFKGDYLNNIREVVFTKDVYVTEFEEQSRYELKVKVPANALSGKVALGDVDENNNPDGLVANLFYSENEIQMGAPTINEADRGALNALDTVKVTGAHLDMIASVNFGGKDAWFETAEDGNSLKAVLPLDAADGDLNLVSYEGDSYQAGAYTTVVPGSLTVAAETRYKAGLNATIKGSGLKLVTGITLGGAECSYAYSSNDDEITVTISDQAKSGAFVLTLANGKTVETEEIALVVPAVEAITPAELFAGDEDIVVKGADLDLVASATLGGKDIAIKSKSETEITLECTATAVSGKVVLTLANGEKVEPETDITVKYHSLVIVTERPAAQHIGQIVTLKGVNMKLVENIFIGEEKVTEYAVRTDEELSFIMPWNKVGSYPVNFLLFNGDTETQPEPIEVLLEQNIRTFFEGEVAVSWNNAVTIPYADVKKGMHVQIYYDSTPADYHMIRIINSDWTFNPDGVAAYNFNFSEGGIAEFEVTSELYSLLAGKDMSFTGFGCNITKLVIITDIPQEKTIWEGSSDVTWQGGAVTALSWGGYDWTTVESGMTLKVYISVPEGGQVRFGNGSWAALPTTLTYSNADGDGNLSVTPSDSSVSVVLSDDDIAQLTGAGGLVICGTGFTCTKIVLL